MQGEYVALARARLGERGGEPPVEAVHLFVREGRAVDAVDAVDQGGQVAELGGVGRYGVVDGEFDGWDVCVLAAEHGSSKTA